MKLLINTSNFVFGDGVQVALPFLEELKEIGEDEYFVFLSPQVSGGCLLPAAQSLADSRDISNQLHFLDIQPEPWPTLNAVDAFFFQSRHEGMPNALVEAALCDLPALASDIPEIRTISLGDAWLLKPVDDVNAFADGMKTISEGCDLFSARAKQVAPRIRESFSMESALKNS